MRGPTQSFELRVGFFEVAAHALLAIIHAEHQLRGRTRFVAVPATVIGGKSGKDLFAVVALVGIEPDEATLMFVELAQSAQQRLGTAAPKRPQCVCIHAQMLGEAEQRPGRACRAVARGAFCRRCRTPGLDLVNQAIPQVRILRQSRLAHRRQMRFDEFQQVFRQIAGMKSMAHPEFGRMPAEVGTQRGQGIVNVPVPAHDVGCHQAFEHETHREVIKHRHRDMLRVGVTRMILPPEEHARPARQFERQPLEIAGPVFFGQIQPRQFGYNRCKGVIRQLIDFQLRRAEIFQRQTDVMLHALPPGGIETQLLRRVVPGGQALVEMRGDVADQQRAYRLEGILVGEVLDEGRCRPASADFLPQLVPQGGSLIGEGFLRGGKERLLTLLARRQFKQ